MPSVGVSRAEARMSISFCSRHFSLRVLRCLCSSKPETVNPKCILSFNSAECKAGLWPQTRSCDYVPLTYLDVQQRPRS